MTVFDCIERQSQPILSAIGGPLKDFFVKNDDKDVKKKQPFQQ